MLNTNELHEDDIVPEKEGEYAHNHDLELEAEEKLSQSKFKNIREKLRTCDAEKKAALEEIARVRADFLNSKRRLEDQFKADKERITERVIIDFLPLLDSFDTALSTHNNTSEGETWKKGLLAMHAQFIALLKNYNISEIDTIGKQFNPHEHEAVGSRIAAEGESSDTVAQVLQKGYRRGEAIIRPAKVIIVE